MSDGGGQRYLVALGSNMRHRRYGSPRAVLRRALACLDHGELKLIGAAPLVESTPLGPSRRRYANGVALVSTPLPPPAMLRKLQGIERDFGRRRQGVRWRSRVLDLDIVLWSGGLWRGPGLTVPHPEFRRRGFVLVPAAKLAPRWRDPRTGLTLAQLAVRLTRRAADPTARGWSGP